MSERSEAVWPILPFIMVQDEIKHAVAQAHFDAYAAAIKERKTPAQAMQIADAAAVAKRLARLDTNIYEQTKP